MDIRIDRDKLIEAIEDLKSLANSFQYDEEGLKNEFLESVEEFKKLHISLKDENLNMKTPRFEIGEIDEFIKELNKLKLEYSELSEYRAIHREYEIKDMLTTVIHGIRESTGKKVPRFKTGTKVKDEDGNVFRIQSWIEWDTGQYGSYIEYGVDTRSDKQFQDNTEYWAECDLEKVELTIGE